MNYCRSEIELAVHNTLNEVDYKIAHVFGRQLMVKKIGTIIMTMPVNGVREYSFDNHKVVISNVYNDSYVRFDYKLRSVCKGLLWDRHREFDSNVRMLIFMLNEAYFKKL